MKRRVLLCAIAVVGVCCAAVVVGWVVRSAKPALPYEIVKVTYTHHAALGCPPSVEVHWRAPGDRVSSLVGVPHRDGWQAAADVEIRKALAKRRAEEARQRAIEKEAEQWPRK